MLDTLIFVPFCRAEPDLEFEGLLKRQHTRVKYFQGSLMNAMDLERTKVKNQGFLEWQLTTTAAFSLFNPNFTRVQLNRNVFLFFYSHHIFLIR